MLRGVNFPAWRLSLPRRKMGEVTPAGVRVGTLGFCLRKMQMWLEPILFKNVNRHSKDLFFPSPHDFSFSNY